MEGLERGQVWCRECGKSQKVDTMYCLSSGWPKCCGYTMTLDALSNKNPKKAGSEMSVKPPLGPTPRKKIVRDRIVALSRSIHDYAISDMDDRAVAIAIIKWANELKERAHEFFEIN